MPTIAEVRQQYPQYQDMSDADLAGALHSKFYADMPREEFDKKVGLAPEKAPLTAGETAADVGKSAGIGVVKGGLGLLGAAGDLTDLGAKGLEYASNYINDKVGLPRYERPSTPSVLNNIPTSDSLQKGVEGVTGEFYKPKTTAGEYAQTAGEFAPALIGGPEGLLTKALTRVAVPAAASETAGQLTKGTEYEPWARTAGALLSPGIVAAGRRAITPLPATAERTALANALRGEGVDLTAGQATGSKPMQWLESTLGDMPGSGGRAAEIQTNQGEQFTRAALRRVGEDSPRADGATVNNAFDRIGGQFDAIGARNHLAGDAHLGNDLAAVEGDYNNLVSPSQRAPVIANTIRDIGDQIAANGGHLTGEQYNAMTSRLARQARGAAADPQLHEALIGTREALDDAFERSLHASGNTQDLAALQEARNQYRNLMVIEKAATGAGAQTAEGIISPSQLRNATVSTHGRRNYARGQGDFADLSRAGEAIMKPLPNSGTSPREYMRHALSTVGAVVGGTAGSMGGHTGTAAGAVAGLAAPGVLGRALMSGPVQRYLGNQRLGPYQGSRANQALAAALLAHQGNVPQTHITVHPDDANR